ncbi:hypothetical protein ABT187_45765 [Streptomyces sp. NPDC001817]
MVLIPGVADTSTQENHAVGCLRLYDASRAERDDFGFAERR